MRAGEGGSKKIAILSFVSHLEPSACYVSSAFTSTLPGQEKCGWRSIYLTLLARTVCRSAAWIIHVYEGVGRKDAGMVGQSRVVAHSVWLETASRSVCRQMQGSNHVKHPSRPDIKYRME